MSNEIKNVDQLEKLARMEAGGVSRDAICKSTGLSESRISQIFESEEFKEIQEQVHAANWEEQELVNRGWDSVEALGINGVVQALQADPDPDFALRAAAVANKAIRRGDYKNNPIAANVGMKAVIVMNNTFIDRIKERQIGGNTVEQLSDEKKASDFMPPKDVQSLLKINREEDPFNKVESGREEPDLLPDFIPLSTEER